MSEAPAKPRHFQVTLLGILVSTLWCAVFTCGLMLLHEHRQHPLASAQNEGSLYLVDSLLLFVSLPAAIDSLFGRAWRGMLVGIVLLVLFLLLLRILS